MLKKDIKIALVHDFLTQYGGAERVLEVFAEMFPQAPIYTLLHDEEKMHGKFANCEIIPSFLQKLPKFLRRRKQYLLPLLPTIPETFNLREFDLVISSSSAWSKGIVTRLNTAHIAYIHSPMRFVWDANEEYLKQQKRGFVTNFFARAILSYLRIWDKLAADRPDFIISNSIYTRKRVKKYYGRESAVIYPPVDAKFQIPNSKFQINPKSQIINLESKEKNTKYEIQDTKYFLIVSRFSPYKKIDAATEAFNKLELPLVIIGEGRQEKYLKSIANKNITFLGWQPDEKISEYYSKARAFIFPGVDDFGLAPAEAMSRAVPVLAIKKGGAKEIIEEGITGEFFEASTPEVIANCVRNFMEKESGYDRGLIRQKSEKFGKERFVREIREFINQIT